MLREQQILRAGQQELTAPASVSVDLLFDVGQQTGDVLYLIEDHRRRVHFQEAARIFRGRRTNIRWFQRNIPVAPAEQMVQEGCFAGLARPGEDHSRELGSGLLQDRLQRAFDIRWAHEQSL